MANKNTLQRGSQVSLHNCVLFIKSKYTNGDPAWMALRFANGNLSASNDYEYTYMYDRGKLDDVRAGDEKPMKLSFEGKFTFVSSNEGVTEEAFKENLTVHELLCGREMRNNVDHGTPRLTGIREPWLTAFGCPPYAVEIEVHNNPSLECPDSEAIGEAFLYRYFRAESIQANFENGTLSVSGSAHILQPMSARCACLGGVVPNDEGSGEFSYTDVRLAAPMDDATEGDVNFWALDPRDPEHAYNL